MIIQKTYKFRLNPTKREAELFAQFSGCARYVYNYGLSLIKKALEAKTKIPSYKELANLLPALKSHEGTKWLKDPYSQILQQKLKDLERAVKSFFDKLKAKQKANLHFKKKGQGDSFRYPQFIACENSRVYLPKIGWVSYLASQDIEGKIKQATVKKEDDHWYVCIVCTIEKEIIAVNLDPNNAVGIDLGLLHFAYTSDNNVIENPQFLKQSLWKLKRVQKAHSRAIKGGKNRKKLTKKIAKIHLKIRNQRADFLHKITTTLVKNHDIIAVENLAIKNMVRNSRLSRSISDAAWSKFVTFLRYKCAWNGKHLVQIDRFEPTSKICSNCNNKQEMPLNKRLFNCNSCGMSKHRDLNASKNILAAGMSVLKLVDGKDISPPNEARIGGF